MATPTPRPVPTRPAGANAPAAPAAKPSRLDKVRRGLLREAKRFFFYGPEGVGKSSLALDARAIFFDLDRGSGHLDVPRYSFRDDDAWGHIPKSFAEVESGIADLLSAPHDYRALAIDTTDALEAILWEDIVEKAPPTKQGDVVTNIEDFGYGKGYNIAAGRWRILLHRLDELRLKRNMHIMFIGHSIVKSIKNPIGADYDKYRPKLDDRALGILREWCDVIGFVTFDDVAKKDKALAGAGGNVRARGSWNGLRVIHLEHHAAWDAKSRLPLPAMIDLPFESPWAPFRDALEALFSATPEAMRSAIDTELERLGPLFVQASGTETKADSVRAAVTTAGDDISTLSKYLTALKQAQTKEATP